MYVNTRYIHFTRGTSSILLYDLSLLIEVCQILHNDMSVHLQRKWWKMQDQTKQWHNKQKQFLKLGSDTVSAFWWSGELHRQHDLHGQRPVSSGLLLHQRHGLPHPLPHRHLLHPDAGDQSWWLWAMPKGALLQRAGLHQGHTGTSLWRRVSVFFILFIHVVLGLGFNVPWWDAGDVWWPLPLCLESQGCHLIPLS